MKILASLACCCAVFLAPAHAQQRIELPPAEGAPALKAYLWLPAGDAPGPAIVMAHGCSGVGGSKGKPSARFTSWAELFRDAGMRVVLVDSFGSRGIKEICTIKFDERNIKQKDRVADMKSALRWLRARPDVTHVLLAGWSHGAGVVLDTAQDKVGREFRAMLAFYPGCTRLSQKPEKFKAPSPLTIHIGEADDWTPAASCVKLAEAVQARGLQVNVFTYPDAYHSFDEPVGEVKKRPEVPNGVNPGQGVTVGPNPAARALARERVQQWLKEYGATAEAGSPR